MKIEDVVFLPGGELYPSWPPRGDWEPDSTIGFARRWLPNFVGINVEFNGQLVATCWFDGPTWRITWTPAHIPLAATIAAVVLLSTSAACERNGADHQEASEAARAALAIVEAEAETELLHADERGP